MQQLLATEAWVVASALSLCVIAGFLGAAACSGALRRRVRRLEENLSAGNERLAGEQETAQQLRRELAKTTRQLRRLRRLVAIDPLTGIANRRHFDRTLEREVRRARRERTPLSLIFCDIDGFKSYNDTHGHARGDEVLVQVARTLDATFRRGSDLAARYGGEEFVVVLPGVDGAQASLYAERLRREVWRLAIPHAGAPVAERLTISAGVATLSAEELSGDAGLLARAPEVLLNSADAALYRAKCLGRNRVAIKTSAGPAIEAIATAPAPLRATAP